MTAAASIEDRISVHYPKLSAKLRLAADYVANHPVELATRSLRSVAQTSGVSPATFSRLARALGFEDYEQMRESGRLAVGEKLVPFSERARSLQAAGQGLGAMSFLHQQAVAGGANIAYLEQNMSPERLDAAVDALDRAKRVLLVASRGSAGILDYMCYQAQWFRNGWDIAGRSGGSMAATLSRMGPGDVVLVLVKTPYARRSIAALRMAHEIGLTTIVLTDSHSSPAIPFADHGFVVPSDTPNFFSSYVATLVLLDTMISSLLNRAGDEAETRIRKIEEQISQLGENWSEG
ncbi:MAG: MurR/RpiR family transcriptional regulator [Marinibacterium sp.]|nr:MurR/RpiR family transcriptional regulator [Marinibacterium sp.]